MKHGLWIAFTIHSDICSDITQMNETKVHKEINGNQLRYFDKWHTAHLYYLHLIIRSVNVSIKKSNNLGRRYFALIES